MFDKSLCKECGQTPAPLKPFRARGHGNCVCLWGPCNANCYISPHQACVTVSFHRPLCPLYWEICNIMRGDNGDLIRGEVQRLKLPKWEFREQSHCVSRKKPIPYCNSIYFYFRYLAVKRQRTIAVRLRPLPVVPEPLKRYSGIDFSSLSPCCPAGLLLDSVWFSVRTFQSGVTLKIMDTANVFTAESAVALDENNRWFSRLRTLSQNQPNCHILTSQITQTSAA